MKSATYLRKKHVEIKELPLLQLNDNDVLIKNIYSSICGTDVAVYQHGENTRHHILVGEKFGHKIISRVVAVGNNNTDFAVSERVYPYPLFATDSTKRAGTIGLASAIALKYFGVEKMIICDISDFRLSVAQELGFETYNTHSNSFQEKACFYFGNAHSLKGMVADIDIFVDTDDAEEILELFMEHGKIGSRFVMVAVNNNVRIIDLLHFTYSQKVLSVPAIICPKMWLML